jgi:hypothetical protein
VWQQLVGLHLQRRRLKRVLGRDGAVERWAADGLAEKFVDGLRGEFGCGGHKAHCEQMGQEVSMGET